MKPAGMIALTMLFARPGIKAVVIAGTKWESKRAVPKDLDYTSTVVVWLFLSLRGFSFVELESGLINLNEYLNYVKLLCVKYTWHYLSLCSLLSVLCHNIRCGLRGYFWSHVFSCNQDVSRKLFTAISKRLIFLNELGKLLFPVIVEIFMSSRVNQRRWVCLFQPRLGSRKVS